MKKKKVANKSIYIATWGGQDVTGYPICVDHAYDLADVKRQIKRCEKQPGSEGPHRIFKITEVKG